MKTARMIGALAVMAGVMALGTGAIGQEFKGFPDVPKNHWAAQAVNDLAGKGILQGYPAEGAGGKLKAKPQTQTMPQTQTTPPAATKKSAPIGKTSRQQK